ncbi:MAG TPA: NAD(P)-dependent oxidoreductase [Chloroflexota bacterium]|nr:NAD(P)-dependent oxidoreductase [Chloroflexota bacterium]
MAALLTGVGYIGAALLQRMVERNERVVALDNFYSTPRESVAAALPRWHVEFIEGDIADPQAVARAFERADDQDERLTVYHLAAQPSAATAVREPEVTERANLSGARVVLQAALERAARVVFGGSFRVYGDELTGQCVSEQTPYGRVGDLSHLSKIYVEQLGRMLGGDFVSVRLGVTYGLSPIMKTTPAFMTVPSLFCQRAARGEVLNVLEDRPLAFIHVDDAVSALLLAADLDQKGWHAYNAAPEVATIGQVARTVQDLTRSRGAWVRVHGAAASQATFTVCSRLTDHGFGPTRTLSDGLAPVLEFFSNQ